MEPLEIRTVRVVFERLASGSGEPQSPVNQPRTAAKSDAYRLLSVNNVDGRSVFLADNVLSLVSSWPLESCIWRVVNH